MKHQYPSAYCNPDDYFVNVDDATGEVSYYVANKLPSSVHGMIVNDGGDPCIYYNANSSHEKLQETAQHERQHLVKDDLHSTASANQLEK